MSDEDQAESLGGESSVEPNQAGTDGRVYSAVPVDYEIGFVSGYLHYLVRHVPASGRMDDLGVFAVTNPGFFSFASGPGKNPDGSSRPVHGHHTLPDGTLTSLHVIYSLDRGP